MTTGAIILSINEVVTGAIGWAGQFVDFVTSNPLVLMFVTFGLIGTGIGVLMRLIRG